MIVYIIEMLIGFSVVFYLTTLDWAMGLLALLVLIKFIVNRIAIRRVNDSN